MFKSYLVGLLVVAGSIQISTPAYAWGQYGHVTVCEMAYRFFTDDTRTKVNELMLSHPDRNRFEYNKRFNNACLFADDRPQVGKTRHFINVPRDTIAINADTCPSDKPCTFDGVTNDIEILSNDTKTDAERALSLIYLGHWVGDLHQPLHISFGDDFGGNRIKKTRGGICSSDNLHSMWDNCILDRGVFNYGPLERLLGWNKYSKSYRYADNLIADMKANSVDPRNWVDSELAEWANESYQIAVQPEVKYCVKVGENCQYDTNSIKYKKDTNLPDDGMKRVVLDQQYVDNFAPIVEKRLSQAAIRLAHLVNIALDDNYDEDDAPTYPGN